MSVDFADVPHPPAIGQPYPSGGEWSGTHTALGSPGGGQRQSGLLQSGGTLTGIRAAVTD